MKDIEKKPRNVINPTTVRYFMTLYIEEQMSVSAICKFLNWSRYYGRMVKHLLYGNRTQNDIVVHETMISLGVKL